MIQLTGRETTMTVLSNDIAAFERMRTELEARHDKQWVVFRNGQFHAAFPDFDAAATAAVEQFGAGPYLIRQVGAPSAIQLPGGMIFTPSHALGAGGL